MLCPMCDGCPGALSGLCMKVPWRVCSGLVGLARDEPPKNMGVDAFPAARALHFRKLSEELKPGDATTH